MGLHRDLDDLAIEEESVAAGRAVQTDSSES